MRILTISNCPTLEYLGSGYIVANYVRGLRALGHHVDLLQPDDYEVCKQMRPRATSYRQAIGMRLKSIDQLRRDEYDVVEFYGGESWLATKALSKHRDRRFLLAQHTNGPEPRYEAILDRNFGTNRKPWYQLKQSRFMEAAFTCADVVVTVSNYDRDWLVSERYKPPDRVVAIENPIADEFFASDQPSKGEKLIGFCGTWLPKKGIDVLVRDTSRILGEFPEYRLLLLGVGSLFKKSEYFPSGVCNRIEVIPHVAAKSDLKKQYERIEIFVLPSIIESFGLVVAEAMACGCAVVATKVGFAAGLKNREEVILLDRCESPKLYAAVRELVLDGDLRRALSRNAPRRVQHLKWETAIGKLETTYLSALARFDAAGIG